MRTTGFEEANTTYLSDPHKLVGQVRRFGDAGPAYQIVDLDETGKVVTEVICSGERVICEVAEVLGDPIAETIP